MAKFSNPGGLDKIGGNYSRNQQTPVNRIDGFAT